MATGLKLNIGCGKKHLEGYVNIDRAYDKAYIGKAPEPDIYMDARCLDYPDNCVEEIIAIHLIEHFRYIEVLPLLKEWFRVLEPGGRLILELPDLSKCIANFVRFPAIINYNIMGMYGDMQSVHDAMTHKWGWTPETLAERMQKAGFVDITLEEPKFHVAIRDMRLEAVKPNENDN